MSAITDKIIEEHYLTVVGPACPGDTVTRRAECSCGEQLTPGSQLTYVEHMLGVAEKAVEEDIAHQIELHRDEVQGSSNTSVMIRMAMDVASRIARRLET